MPAGNAFAVLPLITPMTRSSAFMNVAAETLMNSGFWTATYGRLCCVCAAAIDPHRNSARPSGNRMSRFMTLIVIPLLRHKMPGMKTSVLISALVLFMVGMLLVAPRAQQATPSVAIDPDDIGGVVRGPTGPEAGVWVIAETRDLPVRYIKSVVTDDQGRFVVPDLPKARYAVWARGYGLIDSDKTTTEPGRTVNITAKAAPNPAAAAKYYPA